jgi:hypothetical protein
MKPGGHLAPRGPILRPFIKQEASPMVKNMGTLDRAIRVLLAIVVGILYFNGNNKQLLTGQSVIPREKSN